MSLTSWFTEYLYIPLGGNRRGVGRTILNTIIVFTLCGLWHGASWNFVLWGFINGLLFIPLLLSPEVKTRWKHTPLHLDWNNLINMLVLFVFITLCWVFFRSESVGQAFSMIGSLVTNLSKPIALGAVPITMIPLFYLLLLGFVVFEWRGRNAEFALDQVAGHATAFRWGTYILLCFAICFFVQSFGGQFIYQNF